MSAELNVLFNEACKRTKVKRAVREMEPDAQIILYGSRARKDSGAQSDWDFLILLDGPVNDERTDRIRHRLYEIEWDRDHVLCSVVRSREEWNSPHCSVVRSREEWNSPLSKSMPFHQNVAIEGIVL